MTPWKESDRLGALHAYGILDSATDAIFSDFVKIAAEVCEAPIAVVNFIDQNRQWFAAEIGLGVRETPLDVSICAHAILQPDVFVVPDLTRDARFDHNPLVTGDPRLRFYGGALLETDAGLPLGTMCVLDYEARPQGLTERQMETLRALARQVMTQLELRKAVAEKELLVLEAHHRVKNSLQMIQSLLTMQARKTDNAEVTQLLLESAGRVHAFSSMHEHLYRLGAAVEVNLADYLRILVADQGALASTLHDRKIAFRSDDIAWPSADAPTAGLIVLELVTNAQKYGDGAITVDVRRTDDGCVITVDDEGQGLPETFEPSHSKGLGMRVLLGLLGGQGGSLSIDRTRPNTRFVATLKARPQAV